MTALRWWVLAALCIGLIAPRLAFAQASAQTTVSQNQVEVGDPFTVELSVIVTSGPEPSNPKLPTPTGLKVSGPRVGTQQRVSFINGTVERQQGITATWTVVATRPGKYVIGPPTVSIGTGRVASNAVTVEVVPAGALPQRPRRRMRGPFFDDSFDPFGIFPGMRPPSFGDTPEDPFRSDLSSVPEEYRASRADDPVAFLRADASPKSAVVGQQVTLKIFAYDSRGPFEETSTSEPSRGDFLSHSIVNSAHNQPMFRVSIGDKPFFAVKVREIALFPLRTGRLTIGPMKLGFRRPGAPLGHPGAITMRKSEPVEVLVTDPPAAGRPPGYQPGNVGRFSLSATVEPRSIVAGEAVSVFATVEGVGNFPSEPSVPARRGVDWAKPTVTDHVTTSRSVVKGTKKLSYVVRVDQPGLVDLGELTLPFFNPESGSYDVARAALGTVDVTPSEAPVAPAEAVKEDRDALSSLVRGRSSMAASRPEPLRLADRSWFWGFLFVGPLGTVAASGVLRVVRDLRRRLESRRDSPLAQIARALDGARNAARDGNSSGSAALVEKALYLAVEDRTGLKARGVMRAELNERLSARGVPLETARELVDILDACEKTRFTGGSAAPLDLSERATALVSKMGRPSRKERAPG